MNTVIEYSSGVVNPWGWVLIAAGILFLVAVICLGVVEYLNHRKFRISDKVENALMIPGCLAALGCIGAFVLGLAGSSTWSGQQDILDQSYVIQEAGYSQPAQIDDGTYTAQTAEGESVTLFVYEYEFDHYTVTEIPAP